MADLIFDLGVCNGDDSAYYLHKGYRVVGVEANPLLLPELRSRFEKDISEGRYQLLGVGIAQAEGKATFWVCDDHPEWSSFDRSIASRNGCRHHEVAVPTCRFGSLLERFGIPHYAKIDIEGNDDLCLDDIGSRRRPKYLSIEVNGSSQIERLAALGYNKFKIIAQRTLRQPSLATLRLKASLPRRPRSLLVNAEAKLTRHRVDRSWRFRGGCSGPFGEETRGEWLTAEQALELTRVLAAATDLSDWHDIHATFDQGSGARSGGTQSRRASTENRRSEE